MATIIEKIGKCWNSTIFVQPNDKVTVYRLYKNEILAKNVSTGSWINDTKDSKNIIVVKRGKNSLIQCEAILILNSNFLLMIIMTTLKCVRIKISETPQ